MPALLLPVIYLAFISLGLPDSALGSAWPSMYAGLGAGVSWVGAVTAIIAAGTIVSSIMSVRVVERFGTGRTTAASVALTAAGLLGFSQCSAFWQLCLWAVPYGLGAGAGRVPTCAISGTGPGSGRRPQPLAAFKDAMERRFPGAVPAARIGRHPII